MRYNWISAFHEREALSEGMVAMNPTGIVAELLSLLAGIPEDGDNYRSRREAISLANQLAKALEAAA